MNAPRVRTLVAVALLTAALTACSDPQGPEADGAPTGEPSPSASPTEQSATPSSEPTRTEPTEPPPYLPVPDGVSLTEQGADLRLGRRATVAWEPSGENVGVLDVRVDRLERTTLKDFAAFQLDRSQRRSTPFYVRARVVNTGRSDLGGVPVPLYVDAGGVLVQATPIPVRFAPCQPRAFPERFPRGRRVDVCLVYLVPDGGKVDSVTFRPTQDYDPITWTGPVTRPKARR